MITIFFINGVQWEKNMSLYDFEKQCNPTKFFRTHYMSFVNMNYVVSHRLKGRGLLILLKNGVWLAVAVLRKDNFLKRFSGSFILIGVTSLECGVTPRGLGASPNQLATPPNQLATPPNRLAIAPNRLAAPPNQLAALPNQLAAPPNQLATPPNQLAAPPNWLGVTPNRNKIVLNGFL